MESEGNQGTVGTFTPSSLLSKYQDSICATCVPLKDRKLITVAGPVVVKRWFLIGWTSGRQHPKLNSHGLLRTLFIQLPLGGEAEFFLRREAGLEREGFARFPMERVCPCENRNLPENLSQQGSLGTLSGKGQPVTANKPALRHPGCCILTRSVLSLPVAGQVATHRGGPGRWPKTQPGRAPTGCYLVPSGERRKGGRQASSTFLGGEPQGPCQDTDVPQVDTGQGNRSHSRVQGRLMTAVFCCRFPSCSGREAAWGGGGEEEEGGEEAGSQHKTTERASSLRSENTSRLRSRWVAVSVEMKLGGDGREGRVSKRFSAVIHPSRLS